jgi:hypothetical protein
MRPNTTSTLKDFSIAELWQPSVQIRFVKRKVIDFSSQLIGGVQLQKDVNILQQLHTSNLGNQEWKDVPIETLT